MLYYSNVPYRKCNLRNSNVRKPIIFGWTTSAFIFTKFPADNIISIHISDTVGDPSASIIAHTVVLRRCNTTALCVRRMALRSLQMA